MIRVFREEDLKDIIQIWLDTNIKAHSFISKDYWLSNYGMVKEMLPQAEIYIYENDETGEIDGFIGFTGNYMAGIFVKETVQSRGIGKQLLNYAKNMKSRIYLSVYQKNVRAVAFYQREQFRIQSEGVDETTNEKEFTMVWEC